MIYAIRILLLVVILEAVVGLGLIARRAWRVVPQVPDVTLTDPLIMPDLREFARRADRGDYTDWTRFGEALLGKGFYGHAELAFREALRQQPNSLRPRFGLAFSLDRSGRMENSSREYRNVLALPAQSRDESRTHDQALYALGRNALRLEQDDQAAGLFRKNSEFIPAIYQTAKLQIRSGQAKEALPSIAAVLEQVPYSLEFHYLNMRAYEALGQAWRAFQAGTMVERSAYLVSLNFNNDYIRPFDQMTGISRLMRELEMLTEGRNLAEFETELMELRSVIGDAPLVSARAVDEQLLYIAVRKRQPERIFELLERFRAQGEESTQMLESEGDAWQMQGDPEKAAHCWQRALTLTPTRALHRKLANHFGNRDPELRDRHLGQAALLDGINEYRRNELESALRPLDEATRLIPEDPAPWYYIGEINLHLDHREASRAAYERCLELQPGHGRAAAKIAFLDQTPPS